MQIEPLQDHHQAEICAQGMAQSEPWLTLRRSSNHLLRAITNPELEAFVALEGNTVVGMVLLNMHGACRGYIQALWVEQAWRRNGIGARLMEWSEQYIFRRSPNVFLCVSSFNVDAQRFYRRLGYETIGVLKEYLTAEYDEILMRKRLAPLFAWQPLEEK